jgi:hypothetical protein
MERSPENREAPNQSELRPTKDPAVVVKALGATAIKGASK